MRLHLILKQNAVGLIGNILEGVGRLQKVARTNNGTNVRNPLTVDIKFCHSGIVIRQLTAPENGIPSETYSLVDFQIAEVVDEIVCLRSRADNVIGIRTDPTDLATAFRSCSMAEETRLFLTRRENESTLVVKGTNIQNVRLRIKKGQDIEQEVGVLVLDGATAKGISVPAEFENSINIEWPPVSIMKEFFERIESGFYSSEVTWTLENFKMDDKNIETCDLKLSSKSEFTTFESTFPNRQVISTQESEIRNHTDYVGRDVVKSKFGTKRTRAALELGLMVPHNFWFTMIIPGQAALFYYPIKELASSHALCIVGANLDCLSESDTGSHHAVESDDD